MVGHPPGDCQTPVGGYLDLAAASELVERVGWEKAAVQLGLSYDALRNRIRRAKRRPAGQTTPAPANPAKSSPRASETRLIVPDVHVPYHDRRAWKILLDVAKDLSPERVIIMGDFLDCLSLSMHPKSQPDVVKFAVEIDAGNRALDELQAVLPESCSVCYLEGNHESRASRFEAENGNLESILSIKRHLRIAERHIDWVSLRTQDCYHLGPVAYLHGISESKHSGMVHAEQFGPRIGKKHVVFGHMHTSQRFVSNAGYTAQCCGFLGDEKDGAFGYKKGRPAPWALGFLVQEVYGDCVTDTFVSVTNGRACFRGKVY